MEYKFYYWDAPFRGNFVEYILVDLNALYSRRNASEIYPNKKMEINFPGMAPPYLLDLKTEVYYSQMPAIIMHLSRKNGLIQKVEDEYLTLKIIADCHDILTEITNFYGLEMWTKESWEEFRDDRLSEWLELLESYYERELPRLSKLICAALIGPMVFSFPKLKSLVEKRAPKLFSSTVSIESEDGIGELLQGQRDKWGRAYCGGEIEKSLRDVI